MPYDFASDFAAMTDPNVFGEEVLYTPDGEDPVPVNAVVIREPLAANGGERAVTKVMEIYISASSTTGIPIKPDRNADKITVAWGIGDTPAAYLVCEIVSQDSGGWHLKIKGN